MSVTPTEFTIATAMITFDAHPILFSLSSSSILTLTHPTQQASHKILQLHPAGSPGSDCRSDGQQAGVVVEGGLPGGRFGCREKVQRGFRPRPSPNTSVNLQHLSKPSCRGALLATLPRHPKVDSRLQLQAQKPMRGARAMQARRRVPAGETLPPANHKKLGTPQTRRSGRGEPRRECPERRTSSSPSKATCPAVS